LLLAAQLFDYFYQVHMEASFLNNPPQRSVITIDLPAYNGTKSLELSVLVKYGWHVPGLVVYQPESFRIFWIFSAPPPPDAPAHHEPTTARNGSLGGLHPGVKSKEPSFQAAASLKKQTTKTLNDRGDESK
jgi:hypothetical protein